MDNLKRINKYVSCIFLLASIVLLAFGYFDYDPPLGNVLIILYISLAALTFVTFIAYYGRGLLSINFTRSIFKEIIITWLIVFAVGIFVSLWKGNLSYGKLIECFILSLIFSLISLVKEK